MLLLGCNSSSNMYETIAKHSDFPTSVGKLINTSFPLTNNFRTLAVEAKDRGTLTSEMPLSNSPLIISTISHKEGNIVTSHHACNGSGSRWVKSRQTEQPGRGIKTKGLHDECLDDVGDANTVYTLKTVKLDVFIVELQINGLCVPVELDTGASLTIVSKKMFDS